MTDERLGELHLRDEVRRIRRARLARQLSVKVRLADYGAFIAEARAARRYREALEFYADFERYRLPTLPGGVLRDLGGIARDALAREEGTP